MHLILSFFAETALFPYTKWFFRYSINRNLNASFAQDFGEVLTSLYKALAHIRGDNWSSESAAWSRESAEIGYEINEGKEAVVS